MRLLPIDGAGVTEDEIYQQIRGDTLLVPAVSIGSVPQLAFDLLVHHHQPGSSSSSSPSSSIRFERLAYSTASSWCIPFVSPADSLPSPSTSSTSSPSPSPSPAAPLTAAIELYRSASHRLSLLHQRSPIAKAHKHEYAAWLADFAADRGFNEVVLVASLDAGMRVDSEMDTALVMWSTVQDGGDGGGVSAEEAQMQGLGALIRRRIPRFEPRALPAAPATSSGGGKSTDAQASKAPRRPPPLAGAGLTRLVLQAFQEKQGEKAVPCTALLMFCAEGDNRTDAHALARLLASSVAAGTGTAAEKEEKEEGQEEEFREPRSWQALFGPQYDQALFG